MPHDPLVEIENRALRDLEGRVVIQDYFERICAPGRDHRLEGLAAWRLTRGRLHEIFHTAGRHSGPDIHSQDTRRRGEVATCLETLVNRKTRSAVTIILDGMPTGSGVGEIFVGEIPFGESPLRDGTYVSRYGTFRPGSETACGGFLGGSPEETVAQRWAQTGIRLEAYDPLTGTFTDLPAQ